MFDINLKRAFTSQNEISFRGNTRMDRKNIQLCIQFMQLE
jgi:hypothetical protein